MTADHQHKIAPLIFLPRRPPCGQKLIYVWAKLCIEYYNGTKRFRTKRKYVDKKYKKYVYQRKLIMKPYLGQIYRILENIIQIQST